MNFEEALEQLKAGKRVARSHWGGYWFLNQRSITGLERGEVFHMPDMIVAKLKEGGYAPATPYQGDILANDWMVIEA